MLIALLFGSVMLAAYSAYRLYRQFYEPGEAPEFVHRWADGARARVAAASSPRQADSSARARLFAELLRRTGLELPQPVAARTLEIKLVPKQRRSAGPKKAKTGKAGPRKRAPAKRPGPRSSK